jgi:hypothetical protein
MIFLPDEILEYDLGRGHAGYKSFFDSKERFNTNILICRQNFKNKLIGKAKNINRKLKV